MKIHTSPEDLKQELHKAMGFVQQLVSYGINGIGPLDSAKELGDSYLANHKHPTKKDKIDAMIRAEGRKNFTTGFLTSVGGVLSLPIAIPGAMAMNWILQTRMVATIAYIEGFDIQEAPIKTTIAVTLLGERGKELLNSSLEELQYNIREQGLSNIPKKAVLILNQAIARSFIKYASQKGFTRLSKAIPLIGGVLGGVLDLQSNKETAQFALELFSVDQNNPEQENRESTQ